MTGSSGTAPEEPPGDDAGERRQAEREAAFALLGLEAGADERALKSAYARRLKAVRPEVDPAGFQAVRAAYEALRGMLSDPGPGPDRPAATVDPAARDDLLHRVDARRRRGDAAGALAVLDAGLSGGLDLAWRGSLEDALFDRLARDPSVRPALLRGLAARFAWGEATTRQEGRDAEGLALLRGRIEAADLADALRARAEAVRRGEGAPGDTVLLRLLGAYRVGLFDRGLDANEREVAVEVLNAVIGPLAEVDGLIEARTIAALRGALGAAPLVGAPPEAIAPADESAGRAAINPPSKWRWSTAGAFWIAMLVLGGLSSHYGPPRDGASGRGSAPETSQRTAERPSPAMRAPPVPMSFPVRQGDDGRLGLDLSGLLADDARAVVTAVHLVPGDAEPTSVSLDEIAREPVRYALPGGRTLRLQLEYRDGAMSDIFAYDLAAAMRRAAVPPPARPAPAAKPPAPEVRFRPRLVERDGDLFLDLSELLTPANRAGLREIRLTPAPGSAERVLDWEAIAAAPLQPIPRTSGRMRLRVVLSNGTGSRDHVYDPRALLAARDREAGRSAPRNPEPFR